MRLLACAAASVAFALSSWPTAALAQAVPARPDGHILDQPDRIPAAAESMLNTQLAQVRAQTGFDVAVVVVRSVGARPVAAFADAVVRSWPVGDPAEGDGVVILMAVDQRQLRIQAGLAASALLTETEIRQIVDVMLPNLRANDVAGAVIGALAQVLVELHSPVPRAPGDSVDGSDIPVPGTPDTPLVDGPSLPSISLPVGTVSGLFVVAAGYAVVRRVIKGSARLVNPDTWIGSARAGARGSGLWYGRADGSPPAAASGILSGAPGGVHGHW